MHHSKCSKSAMDSLFWFIVITCMATMVKPQCLHGDKYSTDCINKTRNLILSHNNITTLIPNTLKSYQMVTELNLDYNKIRSSNNIKAVSVLKKLRFFSISRNNLLILDFQVFSMNSLLEEIIADDNPGVHIKDKTVNLRKLRKLSLKANKLTRFPHTAFKGFLKLEILDLRRNELGSLQENVLVDLPNLKKLLVSGNPLICLDSALFLISDLSKTAENLIPECTSRKIDVVSTIETNLNNRIHDNRITNRTSSNEEIPLNTDRSIKTPTFTTKNSSTLVNGLNTIKNATEDPSTRKYSPGSNRSQINETTNVSQNRNGTVLTDNKQNSSLADNSIALICFYTICVLVLLSVSIFQLYLLYRRSQSSYKSLIKQIETQETFSSDPELNVLKNNNVD